MQPLGERSFHIMFLARIPWSLRKTGHSGALLSRKTWSDTQLRVATGRNVHSLLESPFLLVYPWIRQTSLTTQHSPFQTPSLHQWLELSSYLFFPNISVLWCGSSSGFPDNSSWEMLLWMTICVPSVFTFYNSWRYQAAEHWVLMAFIDEDRLLQTSLEWENQHWRE